MLRWSLPTAGVSTETAAPLPLKTTLDIVTIFREHGPYVHRVLRRLGVHESDVDDAFQEVFVVIHRKLPRLEPRDSLRPWVYGVCARVSARRRRQQRAVREIASGEIPEAIDPMTPAEILKSAQARSALEVLLASLADDKRAVFVLYELEGLTMQEVAHSLGCPVQTAYSRLRAAREAMEAAVRRHRIHEEFE